MCQMYRVVWTMVLNALRARAAVCVILFLDSRYWIAECVEAAGGRMVHGTKGGNSGTLPGVESLQDAEVLIIAPCGFSIERTAAELDELELLDTEAWKSLPAVISGRVSAPSIRHRGNYRSTCHRCSRPGRSPTHRARVSRSTYSCMTDTVPVHNPGLQPTARRRHTLRLVGRNLLPCSRTCVWQ